MHRLLKELGKRGVLLKAAGNDLQVDYRGKLPDTLVFQIKAHKKELLALLIGDKRN